MAVSQCESGGDIHQVYRGHYGKWQFDLETWRSVGGTGYPHHASEAEQDYRAYKLWLSRGWQPWTCRRVLTR